MHSLAMLKYSFSNKPQIKRQENNQGMKLKDYQRIDIKALLLLY